MKIFRAKSIHLLLSRGEGQRHASDKGGINDCRTSGVESARRMKNERSPEEREREREKIAFLSNSRCIVQI
jgi:hypothetical protein